MNDDFDHEPMTDQERRRFEGWWRQYTVVGLTPDQIATKESMPGDELTSEDVSDGLTRYAEALASPTKRRHLVAKHKGAAGGMRATIWKQLQALQKQLGPNGIAVPIDEVVEEFRGSKCVSRKVKRTWRPALRDIVALQRLAFDIDRHESMLDGLLREPELNDRPETITIEIPGFADGIFTRPEDAPELPAPKTLEDYENERMRGE